MEKKETGTQSAVRRQKKLRSKLTYLFWILLYVSVSLLVGVCFYWWTL